MTLKEAYEVKEITDQCVSTIPGHLVDRIFHYYQTYIDPNQKHKPCSCSPTYWSQFLHALKEKVATTMNSHAPKLEDNNQIV